MGDIADMMLDGLLDEETGEYIGDINEELYGEAAPGFPVSHERNRRQGNQPNPSKTNCPECGKRVKKVGLKMHIKVAHDNA